MSGGRSDGGVLSLIIPPSNRPRRATDDYYCFGGKKHDDDDAGRVESSQETRGSTWHDAHIFRALYILLFRKSNHDIIIIVIVAIAVERKRYLYAVFAPNRPPPILSSEYYTPYNTFRLACIFFGIFFTFSFFVFFFLFFSRVKGGTKRAILLHVLLKYILSRRDALL